MTDVAILSKSCKDCAYPKKIASSDPAGYETWKLFHNCNVNYAGSSSGMETAGATEIFSSSKETHGLYYTSYYGDHDSKAYPAVKDIYGPNKPIKKFECVDHYQKGVGSRLCNLKKKTNKQTNKDKRTGGKEKLTNTKTDAIPNYVGIGLRSNVGNLAAMESVCMALMYHTCGYHDNCPKPVDPWC